MMKIRQSQMEALDHAMRLRLVPAVSDHVRNYFDDIVARLSKADLDQKVLSAIEAAHARGIVHRNEVFMFANIVFIADGETSVVDEEKLAALPKSQRMDFLKGVYARLVELEDE